MCRLFLKKKNFDKITAFSTLLILRLGFNRLGFNIWYQVFQMKSSHSYEAISLKLCTEFTSILKVCM